MFNKENENKYNVSKLGIIHYYLKYMQKKIHIYTKDQLWDIFDDAKKRKKTKILVVPFLKLIKMFI